MYCNGCGSSIGGEAMFCSLCGTRQPVAQTIALPAQTFPQQPGRAPWQIQSYRWGWFHGALMIAVGLMLLRPHSTPFGLFIAMLSVVLGICILRRNKLILPLMIASPLTQLFWILAHPEFHVGRLPLFPFIAWWFYIVYYYRRRDEFVKWL